MRRGPRRVRFIELARRLLSNQAIKGGQRHCAVAFRGDRPVAIGYNSYTRTHPVQWAYARRAGRGNRIYIHAEIDAVLRSGGADTLVVIRLNKHNNLVNSKPCPICRLFLEQNGVRKLYHS